MLNQKIWNLALTLWICVLSQTALAETTAQQTNTSTAIPSGVLLFSFSNSESETSSSVWGGEMQLNLQKEGVPFTIGLHLLAQSQTYKQLDSWRWGWGPSFNYYHSTDVGQLFLGIKKIYYSGGGKTTDALDCLRCSNVEETYSGGENFVSFGFLRNGWVFQVDKRLTNNRSQWTQSGYDPYGVGFTWYESLSAPDPELIFQIGRYF